MYGSVRANQVEEHDHRSMSPLPKQKGPISTAQHIATHSQSWRILCETEVTNHLILFLSSISNYLIESPFYFIFLNSLFLYFLCSQNLFMNDHLLVKVLLVK
jgi:hypothetical protein